MSPPDRVQWNMSTQTFTPTVTVGLGPVGFDEVVAVARHAAQVQIHPDALVEIRRTRAVIEALADDPHFSRRLHRLSAPWPPDTSGRDAYPSCAAQLIRSHAAGSGPEVERLVKSRLMLLRLYLGHRTDRCPRGRRPDLRGSAERRHHPGRPRVRQPRLLR